MPSTYLQGIPRPVDLAGVTLDTDFAVARQWAINRDPLFARLRTVPVTSFKVDLWPSQYRPRTTTLAGAGVPDAAATTIPLTTAAFVMNGDILQLASGEFVEILAEPNTTANTVLVRRGVAGTTAAAAAAGTTVTRIGNSRTAAETFQKAITQVPAPSSQYVQTFQHVYSVSGGQEDIRPRYLGPGVSPFDNEKQDKMEVLVDDIEYVAYYGRAEDVGAGANNNTRYKSAGYFNLLTTNNVVAPVNATAYKPSDFLRDTVQRVVANGGQANTAFVSSAWVSGLAIWGFQPQRLDAGGTVFGTSIDAFAVPLLRPNLNFIECPLMEGISAIVGNEADFYWGVLRALGSREYGITGDAREGDWLARQCPLVNNEQKQAAVRNITAFAKEA